MEKYKDYVQVNFKIDKFTNEMLDLLRQYYQENFGMAGHNKELLYRVLYREFRNLLEHDEQTVLDILNKDKDSFNHLLNFTSLVLNESELENKWRKK